jgi:hypothetical protein
MMKLFLRAPLAFIAAVIFTMLEAPFILFRRRKE